MYFGFAKLLIAFRPSSEPHGTATTPRRIGPSASWPEKIEFEMWLSHAR